MSSQLFTA